jgi:hypothetical protein
METVQLADWLWCLRTPAVQAYAVRERDVFNVDPARADETFAALAALDPEIVCFGHGEPIRGAAGARLRAGIAA